MQPNAEERKRVFKPITFENDYTEIKLPTPRKERMSEILASFEKETIILDNTNSNLSNMSLSTSIESHHLADTTEISNNICDKVPGSTKQQTNVNLTPRKSTNNKMDIPSSASRRSQRKTMHLTSYKEISDDEDGNTPKNVSKKTNNRRRTLLPSFEDSASKSGHDMSITNSLDSMNITNDDNETRPNHQQNSIKKTNRRKTVHNHSVMDMTASQANKTPENNLNKITSYLTKTTTPLTINQLTDNNLFKTPTANKLKNDATKQQSTGRKKVSPLIKSVLRRRTMHASAVLAAESPVNTTNNNKMTPTNAIATPTTNVRRRTLFTPNKMVEISKNMEIDSRDQLNDITVDGK